MHNHASIVHYNNITMYLPSDRNRSLDRNPTPFPNPNPQAEHLDPLRRLVGAQRADSTRRARPGVCEPLVRILGLRRRHHLDIVPRIFISLRKLRSIWVKAKQLWLYLSEADSR
jgi:hypothetical protein